MMNTLLNLKNAPPAFSKKNHPKDLSRGMEKSETNIVSQYFKTAFLLLTILLATNNLFAQPGAMSNNTNVDGTYGNNPMTQVGVGANNNVWTYREVANANDLANVRNYQFNSDGYSRTWKLAANPTYNAIQTATYSVAGYDGSIKMNTVTSGRSYTFNLRRGTSYASQSQSVLETAYVPTLINSYTTPSGIIAGQTATGTVTLAAALNTNEYLYLAWSTDSFATSGNSGIVVTTLSSGSTYNYIIPGASANATVRFYPFTSVSSSIPSFSDAPLLTLRMRSSTGENNTGAYSNYTVAGPTITLGTSSGTYNVAVNGTSVVQTSTVTGSNLTANIVATAPTGPAYYEVSSDGGTTWGATATFIQSGGNASGTLSIRYKPTAGENAVAKNIVLTSTGATTKNYSATGTAPNSITVQFQIPGNWSGTTVKVYAFNGGTVNTVGFPGSDMTNVGGGWYSYQLTYTNANTSLLFDNGTSTYQTNDITGVSTSTCWNTTSGSSGVKYVVATTSCPSSSPSVTTPTVTSITNNSAVLGATITNQNASAVTDYGTVYNTSTGVTTQNKLSAGTNPGTVPPSFPYTHSRSLSAETQYFYKGYATNGSGDGLSSEGNFYTLSNPASGTSTITVANPSSATLDLSWTTASFPGSGAGTKGYILLRANSPTIPSLSNSNGAAPVAGAGTTIVSSTILSPATSFTVSGLPQSQTYNFVLIPFTANATSTAATYNYLTGFAPTASGTTLAGPSISGISGTISGGTGIYTGETITINGTNLSGATAVSFNGVAGTIVGTPGASSFQAKMENGTSASGNISVTISGGPLTTAFTFLGYRTAAAGDWTNAGTWTGGILPSTSNRPITVNDFIDITTNISGTQTGAFIINAAGKVTFGASGNLKIQTGNAFINNGTVDMTAGGTFEFVGGATFSNNSTFTAGTGTVNFSGGSTTLAGTTSITFNNLFNSSSLTISRIPTIAGVFRLNGGNVATANAIIYDAGSTLIYATGGSYSTGNEWKVGATTGTAIPSNVSIISSIVNPTGNALTCPGSLTLSGTGIFGMNNNTVPFTVNGDLIINSGGLFRYNNSSTNSPLTVNGNVDIKSGGALNLTNANSGCDMTVGGGFKNAGTFTHNNRKITLNGGAAQVLDGASLNGSGATNCFYDLTINNTSGGVSLSQPVAVTNSLTLSNGIVTTGANTISVTAAGTVSRTSGWVNGNLNKFVTGSSTKTFEIGDATVYTPVTLNFTGTISGGSITAKSISGDHPQIATSNYNVNRTVNRFYTLTPNSVVGLTSYSPIFTYDSTDNDIAATASNYVIRNYTGGTWSAPSISGTPTATSAGTTGLTSFGDFAIGEDKIALEITANSSEKCFGDVKTFAGTEFTITNGSLESGHSITVTLTSTGSGSGAAANTSYPIIASNATGTGLSNYNITYVDGSLVVNPLPTATIAVNNTTQCLNQLTPVVTFTGVVGTGPFTFTYNRTTVINSVTTTLSNLTSTGTVLVPTNAAGTITYTLVSVQDANTCSQAQSGSVTVTVGLCTQVRNTQCGRTLPFINTIIEADAIAGATAYRFELIRTDAPLVDIRYVVTGSTPKFTPGSSLLPAGLIYGKSYNIRVQAYIGGWLSYGNTCVINAPAEPSVSQTRLSTNFCGKTLKDINTSIECDPVYLATQYGFEVSGPSGFATYTYNTPKYYFGFASAIPGVEYNTTYTIRVRAYSGGWGVYGPSCTITTPDVPQTYLLSSNNSVSGCNVTVNSLTPSVSAYEVRYAERYMFKVTIDNDPTVVAEFERLNRGFTAAQFKEQYAPGYEAGKVYKISVQVMYHSMYPMPSGSGYGPVCSIKTPMARMTESVSDAIFNVKAYPNPFASHFSLDIESSSDAQVEMKVYDMIGRQLEVRKASVSELSVQEVGRNYPSGVYNVVVSQGDKVKSVRILKR